MNKRILVLSVTLMCAFLAHSEDKYTLSLLGVYGYNTKFSHTGGFDLTAHAPINKNFEAEAALEYLGPATCAVTGIARPKFPLPVGELFLDGTVNFRYYGNYKSGVLTSAASIGYRMDYVSAQFGVAGILLMDLTQNPQHTQENVAEPFTFIYRVAVNVRPESKSVWNLSIGASNFTPFEYERSFQPIFFLYGHYDFKHNISALLECDFKPSGMFHLTTHFWGVNVRAGIKYSF